MSLTARVGEELARRMNRRKVVRRAAAAIFGSVAAWSTRGFRASAQLANYCTYVERGECSCDPPYGQYCDALNASYCSGASCGSGCTVDETYWEVGGCWCSATCQYADSAGNPIQGYYKCCDCNCYGASCACRQFVQVQQGGPPQGPGGGSPRPPGGRPGGRPGGGPPPDFGTDSGAGSNFPPGFPFND